MVLARYTESQLYGVKPWDNMVVVAAIVALTATAVTATFFPALRASRVSPVRALRYELRRCADIDTCRGAIEADPGTTRSDQSWHGKVRLK